MIERPLWIKRIQDAWKRRPIVWLAGVRRVGKTTLAKSLPSHVYVNCDRLDQARELDSAPESFFEAQARDAVVVLDEVHRLQDPARILKIAADEFGYLRVLATGSSTLQATRKFSDSLAGRKHVVLLRPALWSEVEAGFGRPDLEQRLLRGGLPPFLLAEEREAEDYAEWLDSYFSRDIHALFGTRQRDGFLKLMHLVLRQSGSIADYNSLASESGLSRPSVQTYLDSMKVTCALTAVASFHGGGKREVLAHPKLYAFDTGFVCYARAWESLHPENLGLLWEHLVLDEILFAAPQLPVYFWRDRAKREVDFVIPNGRGKADAIECKITPQRFRGESLQAFREAYPKGRNFVVAPFQKGSVQWRVAGLPVTVLGCVDLGRAIL